MISIAEHKAKWAAAKNRSTRVLPAEQPKPSGGDYNLMAAAVKQDVEHLKAEFPDDHAARNAAKGKLLDKYRGYLTDWMQAGQSHQNDVLVQNAMWALDSGHYDWMLVLADYAVKTQQALTWAKRSLATLIADSVVQAADEQLIRRENKKRVGAVKPDTDDLMALEQTFNALLDRVNHWPLSAKNIIRAQYALVAGFLAERDENWVAAVKWYGLATELKPDIGVKGRLKDAEKYVPTAQPTTPAGDTDGVDNPPESTAGAG